MKRPTRSEQAQRQVQRKRNTRKFHLPQAGWMRRDLLLTRQTESEKMEKAFGSRTGLKSARSKPLNKEIKYSCPKCKRMVIGKFTSNQSDQEDQVRVMEAHWIQHHSMSLREAFAWIDQNQPRSKPTTKRSDNMEANSVELVNFEILPPSEWTLENTIEHYKKNERAIVTRWKYSIDYDRIKEIYKLQPDKRYWGSGGFFGYSVYEFSKFEKVILDCPVEGNAVYMLYKNDWMDQVLYTKKEIREYCSGQYRKIVHKGDWLDRVRQELAVVVFED